MTFKTGGGEKTNFMYSKEVLKYDTSLSFYNGEKKWVSRTVAMPFQ